MITRRAICIWRSIEELLCKHCCSGKSKAPYSHLFPAPLYPIFSTLSHKSNDFRKKKKLLSTKCVFWFSLQLLSETFPILTRNERILITKNMYIGLGVYHPWLFSDFIKLCVSQQIFEIYSYVNVEISVNSSHKHN